MGPSYRTDQLLHRKMLGMMSRVARAVYCRPEPASDEKSLQAPAAQMSRSGHQIPAGRGLEAMTHNEVVS